MFSVSSTGNRQIKTLTICRVGNLFASGQTVRAGIRPGQKIKKLTDKVRLPSVIFQSFRTLVIVIALLSSAVAIKTGRADVVYVANAIGGAVDAINSAGVSSVFATTPGGADAFGLAFDSAGNLYVGDTSEIFKYTPGGAGSVFANNGLSDPAGFAFDRAGNLYVANTGNNTIEKFTPGGGGNVFARTGLNAPTGLAFDSAGNRMALR